MPQIEVTFDIDANGIVNVSAKDKGTGKEQTIQIKASGGLSDEDVDRMVKEAEDNADSDKERKESIEARNNAEGMMHSAEKSLKEHGDKIEEADKTAIEEAIEEVKTILADENASVDDIKAKSDTLMEASMKLGEAIYKAEQESPQAEEGTESTAETGESTTDEDVVDADFEDVTDEDGDDKKSA